MFKSISFSGYSLKSVLTELRESILNSQVERACYWSAELVCSGHLIELWETLIHVAGNNLGHAQPLILIYFAKRLTEFKKLVNVAYPGRELDLRNEKNARELFGEIAALLAVSSKTPSLSFTKPSKDSFTMIDINTRCSAPNDRYVELVWEKSDPIYFKQSINEIIYNLTSENGSVYNCCYWIEWFIIFVDLCKKNKLSISVTPRYFIPIKSKHNDHPIWLVWQALWTYAKQKPDKLPEMVIDSLLQMFCLRFRPSTIKKRKALFYTAVSFLRATPNHIPPLLNAHDKEIVSTAVTKIDIVYKQIGKAERSSMPLPEKGKTATCCSLKRLEIVSDVDNAFRVRI